MPKTRPKPPAPDLGAAVGTALKAFRKARGLSQQALAKRLAAAGVRVNQGDVSKVETGYTLASWARLAAFCAALGCRPSQVVTLAEAAAGAARG